MMKLSGTRVYLAGAVEHNFDNAVSWRDSITAKLKQYNITVYNPLVKPQWLPQNCKVDPALYKAVLSGQSTDMTKEEVFQATSDVRRLCLRMVTSADFVICYMPKVFTCGTFEEIYLAASLEKPVLFCMPDGMISTWLLPVFANAKNMNDVYFYNWDSLLDHIDKLNNGQARIDAYKWLSSNY
jgi:nucleoside 2-deoxyribosyltransferase